MELQFWVLLKLLSQICRTRCQLIEFISSSIRMAKEPLHALPNKIEIIKNGILDQSTENNDDDSEDARRYFGKMGEHE